MRPLRTTALAALAISTFSFAPPAAARIGNICEQEMARTSESYGIPLGVLYAVGLTETGVKGSLQPYAMNVEGKPFFGGSAAETVAAFRKAEAGGARLIDLGCMQINHHYHGENFASVEAMLEPRQNVDYAARFLKTLRGREGSWTLAVARYHAGPDNNPAQKRYVCAVITNMVATGFGSWTAAARDFCR